MNADVRAGLIVPAVLAGIVLVAVTVMWRSARPAPPSGRPPRPLAQSPVSLGAVSWPEAGVSAADITGLGVAAGPGAHRRVPIASVAMVMTAYVLEALLLPSADNMAWTWPAGTAGSQAGFMARMNATARALGMTATRYTDPSGLAGLKTGSDSAAGGCVLLASWRDGAHAITDNPPLRERGQPAATGTQAAQHDPSPPGFTAAASAVVV